MSFWRAYFDESGKDEAVLVVAGYLANDTVWRKFIKKWNKPLTKDGRTVISHATDLEGGRGDFTIEKGWSDDRRAIVREKLISVLESNLTLGVYTAVVVDDYERMITGARREHFGTPYDFCVRNCLRHISIICQEIRQPHPVAYIVERGGGKQRHLREAFDNEFNNELTQKLFRLGSLVFETKERAVPLQAADMLAYYTWNTLNGVRYGPPVNRVVKTIHSYCYYDAEELEKQFKREEQEFSVRYPEGVMSHKPPSKFEVNVTADAEQVGPLFDELDSLMESFPEETYALINDSANVAKLIGVDAENVSAGGTGNLRVTFKPSDLSEGLVSAVRTLQRNGKLSE
jgi:Protein of unknown function (DUF3800)